MSENDNSFGASGRHPAPRKFRVSFVAGLMLGVVAFGNLAYEGAAFAYNHSDAIVQIVNGKAGLEALRGKPDLFKSDVYLAFDQGNGNVQVFRATLHGSEDLTGEIQDVESGTKGLVRGHLRAGTVTLEYASKDPNRTGYGSFVLRPYVSASETDTPVYAGLAVFHDCKCPDGSTRQYGTIQTTQAVMTANPSLPNHLKTQFFGKGPQKVPALFPEDIQKLADGPRTGSGACLRGVRPA